jgi:hypothetical protein
MTTRRASAWLSELAHDLKLLFMGLCLAAAGGILLGFLFYLMTGVTR